MGIRAAGGLAQDAPGLAFGIPGGAIDANPVLSTGAEQAKPMPKRADGPSATDEFADHGVNNLVLMPLSHLVPRCNPQACITNHNRRDRQPTTTPD
jgi:hypothetical protein